MNDQPNLFTILTRQQYDAAMQITAWYNSIKAEHNRHNISVSKIKPYYFLSGFAGTGKTFATYHIVSTGLGLHIPEISAFRKAEKEYREQPPTDDPQDRLLPPSYATTFAAFTAKAAQVMQSKHIPASTIHSLLYTPDVDYALISSLEQELSKYPSRLNQLSADDPIIDHVLELRRKLREAKEPKFSYIHPSNPRSRLRSTKLLVLDECSMIGEELWADLLKTGIPILIIGDIGQLEPVKSQSAAFAKLPPDYHMTEIQRQASDSPIIQFASLAREQKLIPFQRVKSPSHTAANPQLASRIQLRQFQANHLTKNDLEWFDQIICATHRRRQQLNRLYRSLMFNCAPESLPIFPQVGERILCGKNDYSSNLFNGVVYYVTSINEESYNAALHALNVYSSPTLQSLFKQNDPFGNDKSTPKKKADIIKFELMAIDPNATAADPTNRTPILDPESAVTVHAPVATFLDYNDPQSAPSNDFLFDYGYAITVHKSQGSQWSRVLVYNERMHAQQTSEEYAKWLYTAITRASDCVVLAG